MRRKLWTFFITPLSTQLDPAVNGMRANRDATNSEIDSEASILAHSLHFSCDVLLRQCLVRSFAGRFPKSDPNIFASSIRFPNALRMSGPQRLQQASIQSSKQHHEIYPSQPQILQGKIAGSSKMPLWDDKLDRNPI